MNYSKYTVSPSLLPPPPPKKKNCGSKIVFPEYSNLW